MDDTPDSTGDGAPTKHYHGHRECIRARIMRGDGEHMDDYEILEVLLCAFIPRVDVRPIAKTMVDRFGTVSAALAAAPERLKEIEGIGAQQPPTSDPPTCCCSVLLEIR